MEWLFSTKKGREELTSQAKYQRLAIVHLNRAHTYGSLDSIISELSPKVRDLAPKGIPVAYKVIQSIDLDFFLLNSIFN